MAQQPPPPSTVVLHAADAPVVRGAWRVEADSSAAGGRRVSHPDANQTFSAAAQPANYFQLTFHARANQPYHLWIRGRAENDSDTNESVWVQFSDSVTATGAATYRIGTTAATEVNLEDCLDCNVQGWGWQDNGWAAGGNAIGPDIYFASTGMHTIRVQTRQDGFSIDQIVLSPNTYLTSSPGTMKNDAVRLASTPREIIIWADDVATGDVHGLWAKVAAAGAAGDTALHHPNADAAVTGPSASPANYFDVAFTAQANVPYHLWIRGRPQNDSDANDSVWVQFSDSVNSTQNPIYRISTSSATEVNLEDCLDCNVQGWGWQDNGWTSTGGAMGPNIYFPTSGPRTLRVQTRQDGLYIDQIVLSPVAYLGYSPGALDNDGLILSSTINARPVLALTAAPVSGNAPLTVTFDAITYDPDGASLTYLWTFSPGFTSTAPPPQQHTFSAGEYTPKLRVTDAAGKFTEASVAVSAQTTTTTKTRFKFMSWNVQHGLMADDSTKNLPDVAEYIKNQGVSVVALNEAPQGTHGYTDYAKALRDELQTLMPGRTWKYRWIQPDGNALLWLDPSTTTAPTPGFTTVTSSVPVYEYAVWGNYPRSAGSVTLSIAGRDVTFIATHLECECRQPLQPDETVPNENDREAQATELMAWDDSAGNLRIIGGDFNVVTPADLSDPAVEQTIPRIRGYYNDAWISAPSRTTDYPDGSSRTVTWSTGVRVDYVFFQKNVTNFAIVAIKHGYPKSPTGTVLADHFPVIATFEIW